MTTIATGQHRELADAALAAFGLRADVDLKVMEANQRPTDVIARVMLALPAVLDTIRPDVVLVQGDTASTLGGALCAYHAKVPVGHVEAGLRTADRYSPFPEEMNRRLTSAIESTAREIRARVTRATYGIPVPASIRGRSCPASRRRRPACASLRSIHAATRVPPGSC